MTQYSTDYTIDELVVCSLAREIRDGEFVAQGGGTALGIVSVLLARLTHAPNLKYNYLSSVDPLFDNIGPDHSPDSVRGTALQRNMTIDGMVSMCIRGKIDVFSTMPAQIDRYGNVNVSLIGDHQQPQTRFPGGYGITDWFLYANRVYAYLPKHTRRAFVEKVDYITGQGHIAGETNGRQRLGIPGQGPQRVVTNLGIMGFDEDTHAMRLDSVHPGVTQDEIEANTGFELIVGSDLQETEPPTVEQVDLIRNRIDPMGLRKHRFDL